MRAIRAAIKEFEYSDVEPELWSEEEKVDFVDAVKSEMAHDELGDFTESVWEIIPEEIHPYQTEAFAHEWTKAAIGILFTDQHIEIIRSATFARDDIINGVKRSDCH